MESVVISDQEILVVTTDTTEVVVSTINTTEVVVTGIMGPPGPSGSITNAVDVDASNLINGSTLIYSTTVGKWVTTTLLENQILEAGQF